MLYTYAIWLTYMTKSIIEAKEFLPAVKQKSSALYVLTFLITVFISSFVVMSSSANAATIRQVSTGNAHACAIVDGKLRCWGDNASGQLGDNSKRNAVTPVSLYTKAAYTESKRVCSGVELFGGCYFGSWSTVTTNHPATPLYNAIVTKVSAGEHHTCAIAGARVFCWGENDHGQLGNNSTTDSSRPIAVINTGALKSKELIDVTAGDGFTCALASDGTVACWGRNDTGQLGTGNRDSSRTPVAVSQAAAQPVKPGYCNGTFNQLTGCGFPTGRWVNEVPAVPASALQNQKVKKLALLKGAAATMCAITIEDKAVCWGENDLGQIGNGGAVSEPGKGTGYNRANQAHRCGNTKSKALSLAVADLPANIRKDALLPTNVSTSQLFSDLIVTGNGREIADTGRLGGNGDYMEKINSYTYVSAKPTSSSVGAERAYYWGGSMISSASVDCRVNGQAYYGESTKSDATIIRYYFGQTTPQGPLYNTENANGLQGQKLAYQSGNSFTGSNHTDNKQCVTLTEAIYFMFWEVGSTSQTACSESAKSTGCATPASNRSSVHCDDSSETCTDNSNGSAFHIAMLKATGQYRQVCIVNGPQSVPAGANSWLKPGQTITALDTGFSGYTCAVANNNSLGCWGKNTKGQLGVGDTVDKTIPTEVRF